MKTITKDLFPIPLLAFLLTIMSCGAEQNRSIKPQEMAQKTRLSDDKIPEVKVLKVENGSIGSIIELTGRLKALREIAVVSEVQGKVLKSAKELDVGITFQQGETLVEIERTQLDLSLYAMRAKFVSQIMNLLSDLEADHPEAYPKWLAYTDQFDHQQLLPQLPHFESSREKYLFNLNNIPGQYLDIKAQEEQLSKYRIVAPFSGIITQSSLDYGDIITPGKSIAQFLGTSVYELEAAISEQDLPYLKIGSIVQLKNTNTQKTYKGRILRTGGIINENTQTIPIYISVSGRGLKQGMFLEATVRGKSFDKVVAIPSNLITRNNEVYIIEGDSIELLPIESVGHLAGKRIVRGIPDGSLIVNQTISTATLRGKVKTVLSEAL